VPLQGPLAASQLERTPHASIHSGAAEDRPFGGGERLKGAAGGAVIGGIAGNAGAGAVVGTAVGGVKARQNQKGENEQAQQQQQQALNTYYTAYGACMDGRGYTVK